MRIITRHDEFAYTQETIKLEVEDYILKPVDPKYLSDVLAAMIRKIEDKQYHQQLIAQVSIQIDKNITILRECFGQKWIKENIEEDTLHEQLSFLSLPFAKPIGLTLMSWNTNHQLHMNSDRNKLLNHYAIENIAHGYLKECKNTYMLFRDDHNDFLLS